MVLHLLLISLPTLVVIVLSPFLPLAISFHLFRWINGLFRHYFWRRVVGKLSLVVCFDVQHLDHQNNVCNILFLKTMVHIC